MLDSRGVSDRGMVHITKTKLAESNPTAHVKVEVKGA
jgi:hypothetical protein